MVGVCVTVRDSRATAAILLPPSIQKLAFEGFLHTSPLLHWEGEKPAAIELMYFFAFSPMAGTQ